MNYAAAIEYILSFADFERTGRFQERPDVAPMLSLLHRLGDPHLGRRTVHVAGSKGKGSVSAMIESVLRAAEQRTGLYTSPHLHDFTERVRIGGEPIPRQDFARLVGEMRPAIEAEREAGNEQIVTFDLLTALGFMAFREAGVRTQVIEVGLGGRLDQTNVFESKEVAVITPLSYEHTSVLGRRIEQIAAEKAAIITPGCVAVMAPQRYPEAAAVVRDFAASAGARLVNVAAEYRVTVEAHGLRGQKMRIDGLAAIEAHLPLLGAHQAENATTAVAAVHALRDRMDITDQQIVRGLESVRWPGRIEVLSEMPLVLADGAHNGDSARRLRETLTEYFPGRTVTFIIGAGGDKDIVGLAEELAPVADRVIATMAKHPRSMAYRLVADAFKHAGLPAEVAESVPESIDLALAGNHESGLICLTGSLFVAAEGREYFDETFPVEE